MRNAVLACTSVAALAAVLTAVRLGSRGESSVLAPATAGSAGAAAAPAAAPAGVETVWFDDALPAGATGSPNWNWVGAGPAPYSGSLCHLSGLEAGLHQYQFKGAGKTLLLKPGDEFFVYAMLDPANPPEMIMLQFFDGTWEHRAYWGKRMVAAGVEGTASQRFMGPLPAAGKWVRLQVPSWRAGLDGCTLNGLAITMHGGRAAFDRAGRLEKDLYFPTSPDWETVSFAELGWDSSGLAGLLAYLDLTGSRTFLVLKGGKILVEAYWDGWDLDVTHPLYSATKGHTSLLVGNAAHRGDLSLADAVSDHLGPGWSNASPAQEAAITVGHLVTMTSGLDDDLNYQAPAGTQWRYSGAYYKNFDVLLAATGKTNTQLTQEEIVAPTGMGNTYYNEGEGWVQTTNRDCGRYGLMMLAGGQWNGASIVHDKKYLGEAINSSQPMNPTYGYLWWLNGKSGYMLPGDTTVRPGPLMPEAPSEAYLAAGAFHQYVVPVPSHDLVVVRMGSFNLTPADVYLNEIVRRVVAMAPNTAPIVSGLPDVAIDEDTVAGPIPFSVSDRQSTPYVLTVTASSDNPALVPASGLVLAGEGEGRTLTVTPAPDAHGSATITLRVTDKRGLSASSSFTLTVNPVNHPPVADDQALDVDENTPTAVTLTGSDPDGDALEFEVLEVPEHGSLSGEPPSLIYTPEAGYCGPDGFTFVANDGDTRSAPARVSISVATVNDDPEISTAFPETPFSMHAGTSQVFQVWADDPDGDQLSYAWKLDGEFVGTNSPAYSYGPAVTGSHTISVTVSDGRGGTDGQTWAVTVSDDTPPPPPKPHGGGGGGGCSLAWTPAGGPGALGGLLPGAAAALAWLAARRRRRRE